MTGVTPEPDEIEPGTQAPSGIETIEAAWPAPRMRVGMVRHRRPFPPQTPDELQRTAGRRGAARRTAARAKPPRHPAVALSGMIIFGLLAAFFAGQSAEPLWLAFGRGEAGTAYLTRCDAVTGAAPAPAPGQPAQAAQPASDPVAAGAPAPSSYRCVAFTTTRDAVQVGDVTLFGVDPATLQDGDRVPARMVTTDHGRAYAVGTAGLHLRWLVGLTMVGLCGAGVAWATGATRTRDTRQRRRALLLSYAGPVLLTAGILTAAW